MDTEDTLARATRRNRALQQSLKTLIESNRLSKPETEKQKEVSEPYRDALHKELSDSETEEAGKDTTRQTFFDEFKSNIEQIKKSNYLPPRKPRQEASELTGRNEKGASVQFTADTVPRHNDMLVSKLERQSITIETLEADIRKLRTQNQQLRESNYGLRERVKAAEAQRKSVAIAGETVSANPMATKPNLQKQQHVQPQQPLPSSQALLVERDELRTRAQEAEATVERQQHTIDGLRAGLSEMHSRYVGAKQKLEASVDICAFQEKVIIDLKKAKGTERQKNLELDSTEELLDGGWANKHIDSGCEKSPAGDCGSRSNIPGATNDPDHVSVPFDVKNDIGNDSDGTTTQLMRGPLRLPSPYDHLGPNCPLLPRSRFRAGALAVLFCVRVSQAARARTNRTKGQVWR
uniref:Uncharacterized protein n=1 Tax=Candidozyma auris TaxID=498019 RepID=A0A0L0P2C6_CANAR